MKDNQYYPTPESVIKMMLSPYYNEDVYSGYALEGFRDRTILEPSAGEGAILDYIKDHTRYNDGGYYVCEIDPDFQFTLSGKGYDLIGDNFLELETDMYFDLIVMNPPFKDGDKHLLKAWELLNGGDIICLLNEETISNPHTKTRQKLAHIISQHGSTESIGPVFKDAERTTDVNVVIVRLHKDKPETDMFDIGLEEERGERKINFDEKDYQDKIATRSVVRNIMIQIEQSNSAFVNFIKAYEKVRFYLDPLAPNFWKPAEFLMKILENIGNNQKRYNRFTEFTKKQAWHQVLNGDILAKFMTTEMRKNFDAFLKSKSNLSFNEDNVRKILEMIVANRGTIMQAAVVEVFDIMTKYHKDNRIDEGWKTNDSWRVNRKIIIPYFIRYGEYMNADSLKEYGDKFGINYTYESQLLDIDKALCYLSGKDYNKILTVKQALDQHFTELGHIKTGQKFNNTLDSTFFDIKFWKKGTIHLKFKDKDLWERFNIEAAKGKNWLPQNEEPKKRKSEPAPQHSEVLTLF